jgi:uncharacterized RDD family membrane protein YckC
MFREKGDGWSVAHSGIPLIPLLAGVTAAISAVVFLAGLFLRLRVPVLLYHRFQTIQVGTLLSRAAGCLVDCAVAACLSVVILGRFRVQDMPDAEYRYIFSFLFLASLYLYSLAGEFFTGRTFGKFILGLCLRNNIGMKCTLRELMIRNLVKVFEIQLLILPAAVIILTEKNQRLGDLLAGTRVQKTEK